MEWYGINLTEIKNFALSPGQTRSRTYSRKLTLLRDLRWVAKRTCKRKSMTEAMSMKTLRLRAIGSWLISLPGYL